MIYLDELKKVIRPYYNEGHRYYHNMQHICEMLDVAEDMLGTLDKLTHSQLLAILFHDAVYIPGSKENEVNSVRLMKIILGQEWFMSDLSDADINFAGLSIVDTIDHKPLHPDSNIVIDLDLYRLAVPFSKFEEHTDQIRHEFITVSEEDWKVGRKEFLESFLKRDQIFFTDYAKQKGWEQKARENLEKSLKSLSE